MLKIVNANFRGVVEYVASKQADVADLPTTDLSQGSTCFVIETGAVYMFDEEAKEWKAI